MNIPFSIILYSYSKHLKYYLVCNITAIYIFILDDTPDIIEGPFEELSTVTDGPKSVDIGTPVYVVVGNDVSIQCDVHSGIYPFSTSWHRNGANYREGNISEIVIDDAKNGDVFSCIVESCKGSDNMSTTINVFGKFVAIYNVLKLFKLGMCHGWHSTGFLKLLLSATLVYMCVCPHQD